MNTNYTFTSLFANPISLNEGDCGSVVVSKVVVPRIQRPYAQGRMVEESNKVRKDFLKELFAVLTGEVDDLDLNFVYGKVDVVKKDGVDKYVMQLLDGQQRFTTLFLLHWYLINREQVSAKEGADVLRALASFEYETRETSTAFCRMLARLAISGNRFAFSKTCESGGVCSVSPRDAIKTSLDYVHSFESDPTIGAMLTMLDAIDDAYNGDRGMRFAPGTHGHLLENINKIHFTVLSLTKYKLSEELYIKMNARGLPLSPFDCFKADFLGLMDLPEVKKRTQRLVHMNSGLDATAKDEDAVTFKQYFATKLDCFWCDLFWAPTDPSAYDLSYIQFFSRYFAARFMIEHQEDIHGKEWQNNKELRFFHRSYEEDGRHYHGIREFADMVRAYGAKVDYFGDIAVLLNLLKKQKADLLSSMRPIWEPNDVPQMDIFCDGIHKLEQMPLVVLSAVISFIHHFPQCPIELFRVWMKTVNCVVENTNIDSYIPTASTVGNLAFLVERISRSVPVTVMAFYQAMAKVPKNEIGATAVEEEVEKAKRIVEDKDKAEEWMSLFDEIGRHQFLKGMIGFYYSETMHYEEFRDHSKLIFSLFGKDGIAKEYRDDEHSLLRAIMSRIVSWPELSGRFVVEREIKKYLKNLISALNYDGLRERMHVLFSEKLLGLHPSDGGKPSSDVLKVLRKAIVEAPAIDSQENWDGKEALQVLRENVDFYHWALDRGDDVHVYWQYNQVIARVPKKWSCVMMSVFRFARRLADELMMERVLTTNGRDGFDEDYNMYVGQDCQMYKKLENFPWAKVYVRFYTSYQQGYPVEAVVRWSKDGVAKNQETVLCNALGGKQVDIINEEKQIRISAPWTFSEDRPADGSITYEQLKNKIKSIITLKGEADK